MGYESNIKKMYLMNFLGSLQFFAGVFIPFFTLWAGLNYTQIFILESWFMAWIFVLEIPTGAVADYFGRRISITLGCFMNVVAVLVYGSFPNFYLYLLGEFLWAMAVALMSGADNAMIFDSLKELRQTKKSKKVFARYAYVASIAFIVASPVGSFIAGLTDLRTPMLLAAIPIAMAGIVALTLKEPPYKCEKEKTRYLNLIKKGFRLIKNNKALQILTLDAALSFFIFYFILWLYQPMAMKAGMAIAYLGFISSGMNIYGIGLSEKIEAVEKIFGKKRFLALSFLFTGILFIISGLTNYLLLTIAIIFIIWGFRMSRQAVQQHYINQYVPSNNRATVLSTISMIGRILVVIGNPIIGYLMDWSFNSTLMILGGIVILSSLVPFILIKEKMLK
jgi:MFS family permease